MFPSKVDSLAKFGGKPTISSRTVTPWPAPQPEHAQALQAVLDSGRYHRVNHPIVAKLEIELGHWIKNVQVRAVASCTAALHISLDYFRERERERERENTVVISALNWPGAVAPLEFAGFIPFFVDVSLSNACIDEEFALSAIPDNTTGLLITHLFGNAALVPKLRTEVQSRLNGFVIDDCAQSISLGSEKEIESDVLTLSGNGAKHLGAGELGLLCTANEMLIEHVDRVSLSSSSRNGERIFAPMTYGYNYRPNAFSAAIALSRLPTLYEQICWRRKNAEILWFHLAKLPGLQPLFDPGEVLNSFCSFPLRLISESLDLPQQSNVRDCIVDLLVHEGVPAGVWLRKPVWEYLPYFGGKWTIRDFPNTSQLLDTMFYLPEIAPPNGSSVMLLYVKAFEKVWDALPQLTDYIVKYSESK